MFKKNTETTTKTKAELEQEAKEKTIYSNFHNHPNRKTKIWILIVVGIYIFFLASPVIFRQAPEYLYTNLNQYIEYNQIENKQLKIDSWTYCKEQQMMEVQLSIDNTKVSSENDRDIVYNGICNYTVDSKEPTELPTKVVLDTPDYAVVWIGNIPDDWHTVRLSLVTADATNDETNSTKLYTDSSKVQKVDKIEEQTTLNYQIDRIQRKIEDKKKAITKYNNEIKSLNENTEELKNKIADIKKTQMYQTENEQENSDEEISSYESQIDSNSTEIQTYKIKIKHANQTIKDYENLIAKLKKGKG